VRTRFQEHVGVADPYPVGAAIRLGCIGLGPAIPFHAENVVAVGQAGAVIFEISRQVAEYSPPDLRTFRRHDNQFRDKDVAVLLHVDRDVEPINPLFGAC
jgi:hypothetical protein